MQYASLDQMRGTSSRSGSQAATPEVRAAIFMACMPYGQTFEHCRKRSHSYLLPNPAHWLSGHLFERISGLGPSDTQVG